MRNFRNFFLLSFALSLFSLSFSLSSALFFILSPVRPFSKMSVFLAVNSRKTITNTEWREKTTITKWTWHTHRGNIFWKGVNKFIFLNIRHCAFHAAFLLLRHINCAVMVAVKRDSKFVYMLSALKNCMTLHFSRTQRKTMAFKIKSLLRRVTLEMWFLGPRKKSTVPLTKTPKMTLVTRE